MNDVQFDDDFLTSEDLEGATPDFKEVRRPLEPGTYRSSSRTHEKAKTQKGKPSIKIKFMRETFTTKEGAAIKGFPPFETLYFSQRPNFNGTGEISPVSEYLRACGLKFQNWKPAELSELLEEANNIPVMVRVTWEQPYKEAQEMGFEKPKRGDFFKNADGTFAHIKEDPATGKMVTATAKVSGYYQVKN
jgi:hypothetical protein